jgi:putative oxidoreductase
MFDEEGNMKSLLQLIARIFLSVIFLYSGVQKILHISGTRQFMTLHGMPLTGLFLAGAVFVEIFVGLALLLGFKARWAALTLAVYLIPTTLIFHGRFSDQMQIIQFLKNLAIIGGLLMIAAFEGGRIGLDALRKKSR